jgi:hypothetical protein
MLKKIIFSASLFTLSLAGFNQGFNETQKVTAFDREADDEFGSAVDISGDYAIVGVFSDDFGGTNPNMGSAHIYRKNDEGTWEFSQKIFNSDQDDYDRFGWSVAIHDDIAVVGAYREDHNVTDGELLSNAGSVYIFKRNEAGVWSQFQKLVASDRSEEDEFGFSVAVYDDLIVVGSHHASTDVSGGGFSLNAGAAYIFEEAGDGTWSETQKIVASDRLGNPGFPYEEENWNWQFGESVGVYEDLIVVASPYAAKAYVFEKSGALWAEHEMLFYPGASFLDRGANVSIDGSTVVLGTYTWDYSEIFGEESILNAGGAAIFDRSIDGDWSFTRMIVGDDRGAGDHFGFSVSIEGNLIVAGAYRDNHDENTDNDLENAGAVYIYKKIGVDWIQYDKVDASDRAIEDRLGIAVAVSGVTIIAGAPGQNFLPGGGSDVSDAGAAYFYEDTDDPDCPTVYGSQSLSICIGESVIVGGSTYVESGTYTDILTSVDGCDSILTTNLVVVGEDTYTQTLPLCDGNSVIVGESVYTEPGVYTDLFISVGGCDSLVETTVIEGVVVLSNAIYVDEFGLYSDSFDAISFQWMTCDPYEIIPGEINSFLFEPADGEYAVIAYSMDGCADTSDCTIFGEIDDTGFEDLLNSDAVSIYPNPSNGQFNVTIEGFVGAVNVEILNNLGQVIYSNQFNQSIHEINLNTASPGIYLIRLSAEGENIYRKIIIE